MTKLVEIHESSFRAIAARKVAIRKGEPDVEPNAAIRRCNALQFEQSIAKSGLTLHSWNGFGLSHQG